jgi:predicted nucleic acid-binding protein
MSLYLDTSCLLKVLFPEPETGRTLDLIASEARVIVSSLGRIEALTHLHGRVAGRHLTRATAKRLGKRLDALLGTAPYDLMNAPITIYDLAAEQVSGFAPATYCRSLDRLHLATMEALRVRRLLTNDEAQARAAERIGIEVVLPR